MTETIENDPQLLRKRIDLINRLGVIGERANIALICSTIDSRLLLPDASGQQGLGLKISGTQGTGKSHTVEGCLKVQDPSLYYSISTGSDKSFFYLTESMKNKAIILAEAFSLERKKDSGFSYVIRNLLSEGRAVHQVTQKSGSGKFQTQNRTVEGPISLITTTTRERLEKQIESRMISISPDESTIQTRQILAKTAAIAANGTPGIDKKQIAAWQLFHKNLKAAQVIIPFAQDIFSGLVTAPLLPLDARRSFKRFLSLIKAIAILYQFQRGKNQANPIVAEMADYHMAHQILSELFEEGISNQNDTDQERLHFVRKSSPVQMKDLTKEWGISKNAVSKWIKRFEKDGFIAWCKKRGKPFSAEADLKKAKYSGNAYLQTTKKQKQSLGILLPTAFELTNAPEWKEGGELWSVYDLKL
ncbi:MAG: MarR family transcriptional regulator [Nitrospina sp.]|nr:MarR family transcriptional regulator [Nitrospina sp.]